MRHENTPKIDPNFRLPGADNDADDPFNVNMPAEDMHHKGPAGKPMAEHEIWHNAKNQHGVEPC